MDKDKQKQIRVLNVIADERLGGPATYVLQVGKHLMKDGFYFTVAMPAGDKTAARLLWETGLSCYQLRNFKKLPRRTNIVTGFHWVLHWLFYFIPGMISLIRLIKKENIEIVLADGALSLQVPLAAKLSGAKLVWRLSDLVAPKWFRVLLGPFLYFLPDELTACSKAAGRHYLGEKGILDGRCILIYPPVDTNKFHPDYNVVKYRKEFNLKPDEKVVGIVAHINPAKGYEYFVPAVKLIKDKFPNIKFLVVGKRLETQKDYWQRIQALIAKFELEKDFILTGERVDIPELMNLMDVFVLPSVSESFSRAAAEAMACTKPVVATRVGGVPEVVEDGKTGILVPPKDPKAIAEAVLYLLNHPEKAKEMGLKGRQRVIELFDTEKCVQKHKELYQSVLKRANR